MSQYAVIGAGAAVALALIAAAMFGRYEIVAHGSQPILIFRIDRLTGEVQGCMAHPESTGETPQVQAQPRWCKAAIKGL